MAAPQEYDFPELKGEYRVLNKLGEGTFSTVYKAESLSEPGSIVALKRIYQTSGPSRIYNEAGYLNVIKGEGKVVPLLRGLRHNDQVTLVLPYFEHDDFKDLLYTMSAYDMMEYMKHLFMSLKYIHERHHIVHRDIKPSNFLHSAKNHDYLLVDFGLAHTEETTETGKETAAVAAPSAAAAPNASPPRGRRVANGHGNLELEGTRSTPRRNVRNKGKDPETPSQKSKNAQAKGRAQTKGKQRQEKEIEYPLGIDHIMELRDAAPGDVRPAANAARAGTRGFRAPEVLMKFVRQTTAVDIWFAGVTFLSLLSGRYPFFHAPDDLTALAEIASLCGSDALHQAAAACGKRLFLHENSPPVEWQAYCTQLHPNPHDVPQSVYDLLARCLDVNPFTRITAAEALEHPCWAECANLPRDATPMDG